MIGIIGADENHSPRFVLCLVCNARVRAAGTPAAQGKKQGHLDRHRSAGDGVDRDAGDGRREPGATGAPTWSRTCGNWRCLDLLGSTGSAETPPEADVILDVHRE